MAAVQKREGDMNFQEELSSIMWQGDFIRVIDKSIILDLRDYINTMKAGAQSNIWYKAISDCHVCDSFRTIRSLSFALLEKHANPQPIGVSRPPIGFIEAIYKKLIEHEAISTHPMPRKGLLSV